MSGDWPCKSCGHMQQDHGFLRLSDRSLNTACRVPDAEGIDYADGCASFVPIDNLKYLEQIDRINQLKAGAEPADVFDWWR